LISRLGLRIRDLPGHASKSGHSALDALSECRLGFLAGSDILGGQAFYPPVDFVGLLSLKQQEH